MAATSRTRSNGLILQGSGRLFSGDGVFRRCTSPATQSRSAFAVAGAPSFCSRSRSGDLFHHRSAPISSALAPPRKTCMCSPTNHPGSFRCSLHKGSSGGRNAGSSPANRLNARRSAMTNSLVRIGAVEGEWVRRALAALIRPSSHQQRRRAGFFPQPSRLSAMSMAESL